MYTQVKTNDQISITIKPTIHKDNELKQISKPNKEQECKVRAESSITCSVVVKITFL